MSTKHTVKLCSILDMLFHYGFSVHALQSKLWRIKLDEVTLKNGWKIKILLLIMGCIFISSFITLDL